MFAGVYEAQIQGVEQGDYLVMIPSVFKNTAVKLSKWVGSPPQVSDRGFVAFIVGDPAWPVWLGSQGSE